MSSTTPSAISAQTLEGNRLLALLSPETRRRMLPAFKLLTLEMSHLLYEPDAVITHIYFPLTAVTSVLSEMEDGTTVKSQQSVARGWSVSLSFSVVRPRFCVPSRKFLGWLSRWNVRIF